MGTTTELYDKALDLCLVYHKGQFRRDGITPYHTHPIGVADKLTEEDEKVTALLHDILEDTPCTTFVLKKHGIPEHIVDAVIAMTKVKFEPYDDYINNILNNSLATRVKIADIRYNLSDDPSEKQIAKYNKTLPKLLTAKKR